MLASKWSGKKWKVTPQQPKGEYPTGFGEDVTVYPEQVISAEKSDLPLSTAPDIDEYLRTLPQPSVKDAYSEQRRRLGLTLGAVESIASPITEPLRSGIESEKKFGTAGQELLKGKIGEGLADALLAAGQGAVSLGQLSNPEIAVIMQAFKGANEVLPESVSRYINEPITSLSKDLGGQVKPEMEKYTKVADMLAQLLGFTALHKGTSLLSKEGLRYEDQNQEASGLKSSNLEGVINTPRMNAELSGNLGEIQSFASKLNSNPNIKLSSTVKDAVLGLVDNPEIAKAIVPFIPVDVMNNLGAGKFTSQMFFDNPTMFKNLLTSIPDEGIKSSLLRPIINTLARVGTELSGESRGRNIEMTPTNIANTINLISGKPGITTDIGTESSFTGRFAKESGTTQLTNEGFSHESNIQRKNEKTNFIFTEQGEPTIRGTEEQTQRGTPQRASEGVQPKETPQANARIISTAVKTPEGIITGDKPFDAHDTISETKGVVAPEKNRGFVIEDAQGKQSFVGREEAAKVAQEAGQIKEPVKELHSEDLRKAQSSKPSEETIPTKEAGKTQRVSSLKPIEGTGELKQRGLAKSTEAAAIASGITKGFENLPEYRVLSNAPQVQKAAQIIANDPQQAMRMVTGKEKTPDDVLPGFLYAGLKDKALKGELPPETLQQLAQSDWLAKQGTTAGQIVQSFKNQDPLDPIKSLNDIVKSREELFARKTGRENIEAMKERVVNQIARETKKNNLQFRDWNEFVNSLVCK